MTSTALKEILYDLEKFLEAIPEEDYDLIRLSFFNRRQGDFVTVQPRLFFPHSDRILIWEGPSKTFLIYEEKEIADFTDDCLKSVVEALGFEPKRGRWET